MKLLPLPRGEFAMVDDADYNELMRHAWRVWRSNPTKRPYVGRLSPKADGRKLVLLHRQIMGFPPGLDVDHKDGNGLNNQRYNLRPATRSQNLANQKPSKGRALKGIYERCGKKRSTFRVAAFGKYVGTFASEAEAISAYNARALEVAGEFALLNPEPFEDFSI